MQDLRKKITEIEDTWLLPLLNHCNNLFADVFLPSHDHLHHYRVWKYSRELMLVLEKSGARLTPELPVELMLASFFHDTGLIHTRDEKHGLESRRLCEEFFKQGDHPLPEGFPRILYAIEHHDDKSFGRKSRIRGAGKQLLRLLSAGDDLDAFGYTGVYRYAEIFYMRGIITEDLPGRILENLDNRFKNFKSSFKDLDDLINRQEIRYWTSREFFIGLATAIAAEGERPDWKTELIRVFQESIEKQENLLKPDRLLPKLQHEREIKQFFMLIDEENFTEKGLPSRSM